MLKHIIFASAALIAAPALAQEAAPQQTAPETAAPAQAAPAEGQAQSGGATAEQIAQVVDSQLPTYDKDSSGDLNKDEFGTWMITLRQGTEPGLDAQAAETTAWVDQAFAMADSDKNDSVAKEELTSFLGASMAG